MSDDFEKVDGPSVEKEEKAEGVEGGAEGAAK